MVSTAALGMSGCNQCGCSYTDCMFSFLEKMVKYFGRAGQDGRNAVCNPVKCIHEIL